jgi:hypothetical protein
VKEVRETRDYNVDRQKDSRERKSMHRKETGEVRDRIGGKRQDRR